ncbi:unnamed protein product [Chrysodeixis includens]|uniref:Uncharacterized protein n=1 Tax=Chrysodeixis includens TaxID=689277 RepID=A0A9P0C195_CHRIL|nr:unnamed protein product [Chrysodeixis includens]
MKLNKMLDMKCAAISVIFGVMAALMIIWGINDNLDTSFEWQYSIPIISGFWIDSRFIFEHLVAYCAITKIKDFLVIVNKSVEEAIQYLNDKEISTKHEDENLALFDISKRVNNWTDTYKQILVCTQQVSLSFNKMVMLMYQ